MRISDWSSDVCSPPLQPGKAPPVAKRCQSLVIGDTHCAYWVAPPGLERQRRTWQPRSFAAAGALGRAVARASIVMPNIARCIGSSTARDSSRVGKCRQLSVGFHLSFVPTALDFGNPPSRGELSGLLSQEYGKSE